MGTAFKLNSNAAVNVQDCEFDGVHPHGTGNHADCIQFNGGHHCIIKRNFFRNFEQGLCAFDGTQHNTITDNVLVQGTVGVAHFLSMYGNSDRLGCRTQHHRWSGRLEQTFNLSLHQKTNCQRGLYNHLPE